MALAQIKDVIDKERITEEYLRPSGLQVDLLLPYIPYARQDRVKGNTSANQSLSLKIFADFLNSLKFDRVISHDPHSSVAPALINNLVTVSRSQIWNQKDLFTEPKDTVIISPDAGAIKETYELARHWSIPTVCLAEKQRDMKTGEITGTIVHDRNKLLGKHVVIVDDICDGGRTFVEIAKVIDDIGIKSLSLYVTHGIFSKGFEELGNYFELVASCWDYSLEECISMKDIGSLRIKENSRIEIPS